MYAPRVRHGAMVCARVSRVACVSPPGSNPAPPGVFSQSVSFVAVPPALTSHTTVAKGDGPLSGRSVLCLSFSVFFVFRFYRYEVTVDDRVCTCWMV